MNPATLAAPPSSGLILRVTPIEIAVARFVAKQRMNGHNHCRTRAQSLGSASANWRADCYGALCEIAVYASLEREGYRPDYCLLTDGPPPEGPDFHLNGVGFECKAVLPGKRFVCVNAAQHERRKDAPGFYLIGAFETPSRLRLFAPVAFHAVGNWQRMTNGHSPYLSAPVHTLRPLWTWDGLPGATGRENRS